MQIVGLRECPKDAVYKIKDISEYITENIRENGAVREFIDWLLERKKLDEY